MRKNQIRINKISDLNTRTGKIIDINYDTSKASVLVDGKTCDNISFYYHCSPNNTNDAVNAFKIDDGVLIAHINQCKYIIGFADLLPRTCCAKRFFAKITEYDDEENPYDAYYWLCFGGDLSVLEAAPEEIDLVERVTNIPGNPNNVFTKSFMLYNEDEGVEKDERFCAARQCLIKDTNTKEIIKEYPILIDVCRFYCDTDKQALIWYGSGHGEVTAKIVTIKKGYIEKDYEIDMGGTGIHFPDQCPLAGIEPNSFPSNLINDVKDFNIERTEDEITLIELVSYYRVGGKIYEITRNLETDVLDYVVCGTSDYWIWTEDGFEQKPLVTHTSCVEADPDNSYAEESGSTPLQDCSGYGIIDCDSTKSIYERYGIRTQTIDATTWGSSLFNMSIFDKDLVIGGSCIRQDAVDTKHFDVGGCAWIEETGCFQAENCATGGTTVTLNSNRLIHNVDSFKGAWKNQNTLKIEKTIIDNSDGASATRTSGESFSKYSYYCTDYTRYGGSSSEWEEDFWKGKTASNCSGYTGYYPRDEFTISELVNHGKSFLPFFKPEDCWPAVTTETFESIRHEIGHYPITHEWRSEHIMHRWHGPYTAATDFIHAVGIPSGTLATGRYHKQVCVQPGESGYYEPVWNENGGFTYDGDCIWKHIYYGPITTNVWTKKYEVGSKTETYINKYEINDGHNHTITLDASEETKVYFLDDRSSDNAQGLVIAGKRTSESSSSWDIYKDGSNITSTILAALNCNKEDLQDIGLV